MRYKQLDKNLYIKNRTKLMDKMKGKGIAFFNSNDIYSTSADSTMPFKQATDLFYLSGVDQEESILALFPQSSNPAHKEILFLKETNDKIAIWEGAKLNKKQAFEVSGVKTVYWLSEFDKILKVLMAEADLLYVNTNEHTRANTEMQTRSDRFNDWMAAEYPAHPKNRIAPLMHELRSVKEQEEIDQMQRACDITNAGMQRVLKFVKPGVNEFEIEAEFAHEFLSRGSRGFAYTPIIASGFNACVLHYIENDQICNAGDVILMDVGAEYGNYSSDMTRCVPVSGRFTQRQKDVYNSVLKVMKEATDLLQPGVMMAEYHKEVGDLMTRELLNLKLITKHDVEKEDKNWPAYKEYFMHGTSHFIGLDTHDLGLWHQPIQEGNAFTVEPGIYIREENLGIRLENDIIIKQGGNLDLMKDIPLEVKHIEDIMNS